MRKPRLSKNTIKKLLQGEAVESGKYEYETRTEWNEELGAYESFLTRWDENNNCVEWRLGYQGIYEFEKD